jgi:hypothetical protein
LRVPSGHGEAERCNLYPSTPTPGTFSYRPGGTTPGILESDHRPGRDPCTYNSVEDFVNEPTIVGKFLLTSRVAEPAPTSTSCQGGAITGTTTYTYDSERRLTRSVAVNPTGQGSPTVTYAYTAWDSQGRPTTGTVSIAGGPAFPVSVGYDDGARTVTINAGSVSVTTITYDTDGTVVRFRGESSGFVTESVYNITSRAPICR